MRRAGWPHGWRPMRDRYLAIVLLAELVAVLSRHPTECRPFLGTLYRLLGTLYRR
jgi:hypothetical protein